MLTATWRANLTGADDAVLSEERDAGWWTGLPPERGVCPGVGADGALRPLPVSAGAGADGLRARFENAWTLTETLFAGLRGEEAFFRPPDHGLRHPLVFYYGHPAAFAVNKLRAAGLLAGGADARLDRLLATGVDEQDGDDRALDVARWPTVGEVAAYRRAARRLVLEALARLPAGAADHVAWDDPAWAFLMAVEHELIHLETSSVLIRELPAALVRRPRAWPAPHPGLLGDDGGPAPVRLLRVAGADVALGRPAGETVYGWDNEFGSRRIRVAEFLAADRLVANADLAEFVAEGGYEDRRWWSDAGWRWRAARGAGRPRFWALGRSADDLRLRLVFEEVPMAWSAPAVVNHHEASAYCAWRTARDAPETPWRLPTEAEHRRLEGAGVPGDANRGLRWGSESPVGALPANALGARDVAGNVWQWCADHFAPLPGFRPHPLYEDYSTPSFDGAHRVLLGGSFIGGGAWAGPHVRNAFRPHFHQHAGFRLVRSALAADVPETVCRGAPAPYPAALARACCVPKPPP